MPESIEKRERRQPKQKTTEQALSSLMNYCSRAERSSGDALRLMRGWNITDKDAQTVLNRLRKERFIDDTRFAEAYVRDKSRLAGWGVHKIKTGLRGKGVAAEIINYALAEINEDESLEKLRAMMEKKAAGLKGTVYERKGKLMRFGLSRGFDYEVVQNLCDQLIK